MSVTVFDTSLGNNFTSATCPQFFHEFTANSSFNDCHPMSFYLQNSQSYIRQVRKGLSSLETILNNACTVDQTKCTNLMNDLDRQLLDKCSEDYSEGNPVVYAAHQDFLAYEMLFKVTCLPNYAKNDSNASYCYSDALFGKESAVTTNAYLYLLPLGTEYPLLNISTGLMEPSCGKCTTQTMAVYHSYTGQTNQSITSTYPKAAKAINNACGAGTVNETVNRPVQTKPAKNAASHLAPSLTTLLILMIFFMSNV
ncbi:hypothetical protein TRVA0_030S01266 [Trichomonascus vanleenenianus]|uniref:uncharacterized protein n=1 Tax=Trichomonascus vanleenenianus TaxID=2268995 RepID=UPI003EC99127